MASEVKEPDDLKTDSAARAVIAQRKRFFCFHQYEKGEGGKLVKAERETKLELFALTQSNWTTIDEAAVDYYLAQKTEHQKQALQEFGEFMTAEQIQNQIKEFLAARETITVDALPEKSITVPDRNKDGQFEPDGEDGSVFRSKLVRVPYIGWFAGNTETGQMLIVYESLKHGNEHLTLDDVEQMFTPDPEGVLEDCAVQVIGLSKSRLGEHSPPDKGGPSKAKRDELRKKRKAQKKRRKR